MPESSSSNVEELSGCFDAEHLQDYDSSEGMRVNLKENTIISFKVDGEKYFPHFKNQVISYALNHSIKTAALSFKVNKDTVSSWVHQSRKQSVFLNNKTPKPLKICEEDSDAALKFIKWLQCLEVDSDLSKRMLVNKANELAHLFGNCEPDKTNLWFYLYTKRLNDDKTLSKVKINYPDSFKHVVVNFTHKISKKRVSSIFNIDRKRICEWASRIKDGKIKKRDVSKYLTDPAVDIKIWEWYCNQIMKPTGKEVRMKAAHLYKEAGFHVTCSPGWYYRWRARHQLPSVRFSKALRDSELIAWVLKQIDDNKSIFHADLTKQASIFKAPDFKASSSWVFRFIKKYISDIQYGSGNVILPKQLQEQVNEFRKFVCSTIVMKSIAPENIIAFDEVPLKFCYSEEKTESILGKSDWVNCQASLILSCSSNGSLLPAILILSNPLDESVAACDFISVLAQEFCIIDEITIEKWYKILVKYCGSPSILVCDSYGPHNLLKNLLINDLTDKSVDVMLIPGGCSSHLQPVLFGLSRRFKVEVNSCYQRWDHDMKLSGKFQKRFPSNSDIYKWAQSAHSTISSSCKELIKLSFIKAGITNGL